MKDTTPANTMNLGENRSGYRVTMGNRVTPVTSNRNVEVDMMKGYLGENLLEKIFMKKGSENVEEFHTGESRDAGRNKGNMSIGGLCRPRDDR